MMSGFRTPLSLRTFLASTNGSSLVEFALISPILITLMVGSNELARWIRARQHMEDYATMVASDISGASAAVSPFTLAEMIERAGLEVGDRLPLHHVIAQPVLIEDQDKHRRKVGDSAQLASPKRAIQVQDLICRDARQLAGVDGKCVLVAGMRAVHPIRDAAPDLV